MEEDEISFLPEGSKFRWALPAGKPGWAVVAGGSLLCLTPWLAGETESTAVVINTIAVGALISGFEFTRGSAKIFALYFLLLWLLISPDIFSYYYTGWLQSVQKYGVLFVLLPLFAIRHPPLLLPVGLLLVAGFYASTWILGYVWPQAYARITLPGSAFYASARYSEGGYNKHVKWLVPTADYVRIREDAPSKLFGETGPITVLIHGYNTESGEFGSYFDDLIPYIHEDHPSSVVVFDWPTNTSAVARSPVMSILAMLLSSTPIRVSFGSIEKAHFEQSVETANGPSSDRLNELFNFIGERSNGRRVDIIAHSLGCYLVVQALKKHKPVHPAIRNLILLAPYLHDEDLEAPSFKSQITSLKRVHLFYSKNDDVFQYVDRTVLGISGPRDLNSLPINFKLHDVTSILGTSDVHSAYLRRDTAKALDLAKLASN